MYECETCTREFNSAHSCEQHMKDTGHFGPRFECESCTRKFRSVHSAQQHMNSLGHWAPKFPCETCSAKFHTEKAAGQHMQARGHYQYHCKACKKSFPNGNSLQMASTLTYSIRVSRFFQSNHPKHLNSKIHRGANVPCPFCRTGFTSASGLSHHLETGSCNNAPSLNREKLLALVRKRDPHGVITNKQIGWHDETVEQNNTYEANHLSYNGGAWECYICHREFTTLNGLNMHLNSSRHKGKIYHCPNKRGCAKQFVSLAGFFNHLESETCSFMRFDKVQTHVSTILSGSKLISF